MKKLYLIRHAKASWEHPEHPDYERPLTEQGKVDAKDMAQQLKTQGVAPDLIITSSATRALQTAELIATGVGYPLEKIVTDIHIYTGGVEELLAIIKALEPAVNTVLVFGHNPNLTWLAHYLCEEFRQTLVTCGILGLGLEMSSWSNLVETEGQLLSYLHPHHEPIHTPPNAD